MLDPEPVEQCLFRRHDIAHRDRREIGSIGLAGVGVDAGPIGRAEGRAQHVRRHDEELIGIDRLAPPNEAVPPPRLIAVRRVAAGGVVAAGITMGDQHRIPAVGREPAIGLVGDLHLRHHGAVLQSKTRYRKTSVLDGSEIGAPRHNAGQHHHPPQDRREFHGLPPRPG
jgi:hypothetical protein